MQLFESSGRYADQHVCKNHMDLASSRVFLLCTNSIGDVHAVAFQISGDASDMDEVERNILQSVSCLLDVWPSQLYGLTI
jgi:hypothetical protein